MAEKKKAPVERKIVPASEAPKKQNSKKSDEEKTKATLGVATEGKSATGLRVGAIVLWIAAIGFEALAILLLNGVLYLPSIFGIEVSKMTLLIAAIVIDLILVIIGSQLWKKSNRIDPASEKNKLKFWLWNNMGVIAAVIAFFPLIVLLLKDKELDGKTKKIVTVIAAIALLIAGTASYDFDPVSAEDLEQAKASASESGGVAYWTRWGKSYHFDADCQTLKNSEIVYNGTMEEAFEANRTDPCDFCAGGAEQKAGEAENDAA